MNGVAAFAVVIGVMLTLCVAPIVVVLYRRAVLRVMQSGQSPATTIPNLHLGQPRVPLRIEPVERLDDRSPLEGRARKLRVTTLAVHLAAAVPLLAIVSLQYTLTAEENNATYLVLSTVFGCFATAMIPVAATVGVGTRRFRMWLVPAFIAATGLLWFNPDKVIPLLVTMLVLPPILILLLIANRWLKTTAPMLFIVPIFVTLGALIYPLLAIAGLVLGLLGVRYLVRRYADKRTSDQLLLIDVYWALVCIFHATMQLGQSRYWWLSIAAFCGYKGTQLALLPIVVHAVRARPPAQLLLLRVFGSQKRSEELIDEIGIRWRYLGPIHIIGGTDVATADLDPVELWEFLKWRTHDLSVRDERDLNLRLAALDIAPDPDGRYRVNDFICRADTWKMTVVRLLDRCDAVLLDVRGFTAANRGVVYELRKLLGGKPLASIVLLGDDTTQEPDLLKIIQEAWQSIDPASCNATIRDPRLRLLRVHGGGFDASRVMRAICIAATQGVTAASRMPVAATVRA